LQLDEFADGIHDEVEIHFGGGVFGVAKIEQRLFVDDAHAHGGDGVRQGTFSEFAFRDEAADGDGQGDERARNGSGAGATIRL